MLKHQFFTLQEVFKYSIDSPKDEELAEICATKASTKEKIIGRGKVSTMQSGCTKLHQMLMSIRRLSLTTYPSCRCTWEAHMKNCECPRDSSNGRWGDRPPSKQFLNWEINRVDDANVPSSSKRRLGFSWWSGWGHIQHFNKKGWSWQWPKPKHMPVRLFEKLKGNRPCKYRQLGHALSIEGSDWWWWYFWYHPN